MKRSLLLLVCFFCTIAASASITINIVSPNNSTSSYGDNILILAKVTSTYTIQTVKAEVGGKEVVLVYDNLSSGHRATLDIDDLPQGILTITISVEDALGNIQTQTGTFNHNSFPKLVIDSPTVNNVVTSLARIKVAVSDPGSASQTGTVKYGTNTINFTNTLDADVDILPAGSERGRVTLTFEATDASNLKTTKAIDVLVDKGTYIAKIFKNSQDIVAFADQRALIREDAPGGAIQFKLVDISTQVKETIPFGYAAGENYEIRKTEFFAGGVAFIVYTPANEYHLFIYKNQVLTNISANLGKVATGSLNGFQVSGNSVAWIATGFTLAITNLSTLATVYGATSISNIGKTPASSDELVYIKTGIVYKQVISSGAVTQPYTISGATAAWLEGNLVVYRKGAEELYVNQGNGETFLSKIGISPSDVRVKDGYILYNKKNIDNSIQPWIKPPVGTERQVSFFSTDGLGRELGNNGRAIFISGGKSYYVDNQIPFTEISLSSGSIVFQNNDFYWVVGGNIFKYTLPDGGAAPSITSFTPTSALMGATVTIKGHNFTNATSVSFGAVAAQSFAVLDDTTISAVVGNGASGNIIIGNSMGFASFPGFIYIPAEISSIAPTVGKAGDLITITGTNLTTATGVSIGGKPVTAFTVVSPTQITAVAADGVTGNVRITFPLGVVSGPTFTFFPAPKIDTKNDYFPRAGTGESLIITGSNFIGTTSVKFGNTEAASFVVNSSTTITAVIGAGSTGAISVTTPGGTSASNYKLTYIPTPPPPTITSFSPDRAPVGTTITIYGTNLTDIFEVSFGGIKASSFKNSTGTSVQSVVYYGNSGDVKVTTRGGTASLPGFTYLPDPVITGVSATEATKGTAITITGNNFVNVTQLMFGSWPALSYVVNSPTSITAIVGDGSGNLSLRTEAGPAYSNFYIYYIFSLPPSNYNVSSVAATCKGTKNGIINIHAAKSLKYVATVSGNGMVNVAYPFETDLGIADLLAGSYEVCLTVTGQLTYKQCFTVIVAEPQDLSVYSSVNPTTNSVVLSMNGANSYHIRLNDKEITTSSSQITLELKTGDNQLSVSTDLPCQGVITKQITLGSNIQAYPNPFESTVNVALGNKMINSAVVKVYNPSGQVVFNQTYSNQLGSIPVDLSSMPSGLYLLKLSLDKKETVLKIFKK